MAIKNFNKIACLILSLVLVFVLCSVSVFATEASDTFVESDEAVESPETYAGDGEAEPADTTDTVDTAEVADDSDKADDTAEVADGSDKADDTAADTEGKTETTGSTEKESKKLTTGEIVSIVITLVIVIVAVVYCIKNREKVAKFFRECRSEVKKITWTPKNQVAKNTFVVIVVVIIAAIFIAILDLLFSTGVGLLGNL